MNVKLEDIKLNYSYKTVLDGVTINFQAGKIYALLGENGAGKSSIVKILTGAVKPTGGKILLDEKEVVFKKPSDSLKHGIACVYQRPFLADSLTVRENLRIGIKKSVIKKHDASFAIFPKQKVKRFSKLAQFYICGTEIKFDKKAGTLFGDERFFVALASAILREPKVMVLDEPTVFLNEKQSESLFRMLHALSGNGVNVIVITHKKDDLKYCDEKILLDEGKVCETKKYFSADENLSDENNDVSHIPTFKSHFSEFDLKKYRGLGNVGIIPTDRTYLASNPNLTIAQLLYPAVKMHVKKQLEKKSPNKNSDLFGIKFDLETSKVEKEITFEIIKKAGINIRPEEKAYNLSGGMLQRLILERELWNNPDAIVLENPYQGLDNANCQQLKTRLDELSKNGVHIIE